MFLIVPCCSSLKLMVIMPQMHKLYFLPGRGSSLNGRLGLELQSRGCQLHGRVLEGDFATLSFPEQVDHVSADLRELDGRDIPVIANSWRAYWALKVQHKQVVLIL